MLQRIQTVFLFIIIILMTLYMIFPVWLSSMGSDGNIYRLYAFFLYTGPPNNVEAGTWVFWPFSLSGALALLAVIVSAIEVFSYASRMKQIKLGALNSLLLAGVLIAAVWLVSQNQASWTAENAGNYSIGIFFPALSIICNLMANRFIRKDEKLVRSTDRIR